MYKPQAEWPLEGLVPGEKSLSWLPLPPPSRWSCHGDQASPSSSALRRSEQQSVSHLPIPRSEFNGSNVGSGKSIILEEILKTDGQSPVFWTAGQIEFGHVILAWRFAVLFV